tara:strand:+ start:534 stop:2228 length:1695 start_codon:yes stop_codon:yes gene_type:complete
MATEVDKLLIRIDADLSGVRRQLNTLDKQVQQKTRSVSKGFNRIASVAKVALGAVVVQQAGRAGMALINMASEIEEMQGKSSVVFGRFANQVRSELQKFGDEVGRNKFELEGMAASIQDTFVPMGFARGEAAKLSIELTKLATDVASFNNASDTETMNAFQSALVGNHETVRRFGVVITEATLKQELLRMGIKRTGDEVTNAEKVQARLNLILAGTTDAQGDAARTSNSYANEVRALQGSFAELSVALGETMLPTLTKVVDTLDRVVNGFRKFLVAVGLVEGRTEEQFMKMATESAKLSEQLEKANKELNEMFAMRMTTPKGIEGRAKEIERLNNLIDELTGKQEELRSQAGDLLMGMPTFEGYINELKGVKDEVTTTTDNIAKDLDKVTDKFSETEQTIVSAGQGISNALADMLVEGKLNLSSLANVFKDTMKKIIASYIQTQMIVPFLRGMGVPVGVDKFGSVGFKGFAGGGAVSQPTIVGERGPELFVPHSAGVIKNNMDTKNMLGGSPVVVNQSINVDAGVAQTVRAEILTMMPMFKEQAMSAVLDARRRGGSFAATFGG